MPAGIGIDLLEIARLERALRRYPRLAERVFTSSEREYAAARRRPGRHLAARFAAKEAIVKALGAPGGFGLGEVEVRAGQPPHVTLTGRAAELAERRDLTISVSLTHSREHAAAVAIAERR